ncbi:hypothetical protein K438DRAFT_1752699 [Mycena galopus ATCC 62051]|nr:hypothetical protein K438DRAFT_1752699 [Mycena galopus ATCC 62051]
MFYSIKLPEAIERVSRKRGSHVICPGRGRLTEPTDPQLETECASLSGYHMQNRGILSPLQRMPPELTDGTKACRPVDRPSTVWWGRVFHGTLTGRDSGRDGTVDGTGQWTGRDSGRDGTVDGTGQWTGRDSGRDGTVDGTGQWTGRDSGRDGRQRWTDVNPAAKRQKLKTALQTAVKGGEAGADSGAIVGDDVHSDNTHQPSSVNVPASNCLSLRPPVDRTPIFTTVRRRDGRLRGSKAQRQDGTVVRLSVHPTVLDGRGTERFQTAMPWVLTHVSGFWQAVAVSTPALWSLIVFNYNHEMHACPIPMLETHIARAHSLKIHFCGTEIEGCPKYREPAMQFVESTSSLLDVGVFMSFRAPMSLATKLLTRYELRASWAIHRGILMLAPNLIEVHMGIASKDEVVPWPDTNEVIDLPILGHLYGTEELMKILTVSNVGTKALISQLSGVFLWLNKNHSYCEGYLEMVRSRWRSPDCTLRHAAFIAESPDPETLQGLVLLRQEGLDISPSKLNEHDLLATWVYTKKPNFIDYEESSPPVHI